MQRLDQYIAYDAVQILRGNRKAESRLRKNMIQIKCCNDDKQFNALFDNLAASKLTRDYVRGELYPDSWEKIHIYFDDFFSRDLKSEIRWLFKGLESEQDRINGFLKLKKEYDTHILNDNFDAAEETLNRVEALYGVSFWLFENRIYISNARDNKSFELGVENDILEIFGKFWNMRSSKDLSINDYSYFVKREMTLFLNRYPEQNHTASFYMYNFLPMLSELTDEKLLHVLHLAADMTAIDKYLLCIDIAEVGIASEKCPLAGEVLDTVLKYFDNIEDTYLDVIRFLLLKDKRGEIIIDNSLIEIEDLYISGKLEAAFKMANDYLKLNPENIKVYFILLELSQLLEKEANFEGVSATVQCIMECIKSICMIDDKQSESIGTIEKIVSGPIHSKWARDLFNYVVRILQPEGTEDFYESALYTGFSGLTIETITECLAKEESFELLRKRMGSLESPYYKFILALVANRNDEAYSICGVDELRFLLELEKKDEYFFYSKYVEGNKNLPRIFINKAVKTLWKRVSTSSNCVELIDAFLNRFFENENYAYVAPLKAFVERITNEESEEKGRLRISILYYICSRLVDSSFEKKLTVSLEDYLYINKIEKPSEIDASHYDSNERKQLIYFLKNVCIPPIMAPVVLSISSQKELYEERVQICQSLRILDPENEDVYVEEIRELTQKLFVNEGIESIESSKIRVNTDGIKSKIGKDLRNSYNNYIYFRKNNALWRVVSKLKETSEENIVLFTADVNNMFDEIVKAVRDEFVSGDEYGLDGYLSMNIRHGTLEGQIKAPLLKHGMLTPLSSDKNEREVDARWYSRIRDERSIEMIKEAMITFNEDIEKVIYYLKKELIQISTEERKTKGVFDYSLNKQSISFLEANVDDDMSLEQFLDFEFDYLWLKTEKNLEDMKKIIKGEVVEKVCQAFGKLKEVYDSIGKKYKFPKAMDWINEAMNEEVASLERISSWFKLSQDSKKLDFELDLAFEMGLAMIRKIHPEKKFVVRNLDKHINCKIKGDYLKNYVDIFYTLLDNVSTYAKRLPDGIHISGCIISEEDRLLIELENDYDCTKDLTDVKKRLDAEIELLGKDDYLRRSKQEGGSGIPKIYKTMTVDLRWRTDISYEYNVEDDRFKITVKGEK